MGAVPGLGFPGLTNSRSSRGGELAVVSERTSLGRRDGAAMGCAAGPVGVRAADGVVVVYDLTRFSRKILEGERLATTNLTTAGRAPAVPGSDGRRPGESDKISERVKRGTLRLARKGPPAGGARQYGLPGKLPTPPGREPADPREAGSAGASSGRARDGPRV